MCFLKKQYDFALWGFLKYFLLVWCETRTEMSIGSSDSQRCGGRNSHLFCSRSNACSGLGRVCKMLLGMGGGKGNSWSWFVPCAVPCPHCSTASVLGAKITSCDLCWWGWAFTWNLQNLDLMLWEQSWALRFHFLGCSTGGGGTQAAFLECFFRLLWGRTMQVISHTFTVFSKHTHLLFSWF